LPSPLSFRAEQVLLAFDALRPSKPRLQLFDLRKPCQQHLKLGEQLIVPLFP